MFFSAARRGRNGKVGTVRGYQVWRQSVQGCTSIRSVSLLYKRLSRRGFSLIWILIFFPVGLDVQCQCHPSLLSPGFLAASRINIIITRLRCPHNHKPRVLSVLHLTVDHDDSTPSWGKSSNLTTCRFSKQEVDVKPDGVLPLILISFVNAMKAQPHWKNIMKVLSIACSLIPWLMLAFGPVQPYWHARRTYNSFLEAAKG